MSDLLSVQVELYPELLRRLASGERLASEADDTEKLAASLLVAEAIEAERAQEVAPEQEKNAIGVELGVGSGLALGAALGGPLRRAIAKLRGEPAIPEQAAELMKSFRSIMDARSEADAARRKLLIAGAGGVAAGATAVKMLDSKKESKAASEEISGSASGKIVPDNGIKSGSVSSEPKAAAVAESNIEVEEKPVEQKTPETKNARAVLDRFLKNFA